MATVVGFLDLNKQIESLSNRIETALRNHWLDTQTAFEFKKEFYFKRRKAEEKKDVKLLEAVLTKINGEITHRKNAYGCGRQAEA
jgi:hypothetical protein